MKFQIYKKGLLSRFSISEVRSDTWMTNRLSRLAFDIPAPVKSIHQTANNVTPDSTAFSPVWYARQDSNLRPTAPEAVALSI